MSTKYLFCPLHHPRITALVVYGVCRDLMHLLEHPDGWGEIPYTFWKTYLRWGWQFVPEGLKMQFWTFCFRRTIRIKQHCFLSRFLKQNFSGYPLWEWYSSKSHRYTIEEWTPRFHSEQTKKGRVPHLRIAMLHVRTVWRGILFLPSLYFPSVVVQRTALASHPH